MAFRNVYEDIQSITPGPLAGFTRSITPSDTYTKEEIDSMFNDVDSSLGNIYDILDTKVDKTTFDNSINVIINNVIPNSLEEAKKYADDLLADISFDVSSFITEPEAQALIDIETERAKGVESKLQSDLSYIADTVIPEMNTNTAKALDEKVSWDPTHSVISLPSNGSISALHDPSTLEGANLLAQRTYDDGSTYVTEVGSIKNGLTLNSTNRPKIDLPNNNSEEIAYVSDLESISPTKYIQIPINNIQQDKIYSKEEILSWFDVTDENELKSLMTNYNLIQLINESTSSQPKLYRSQIQYIAYETPTQIKVVAIGLKSNLLDLVKLDITINLDGSIINETNSNVNVIMSEIILKWDNLNIIS